MPDPQNIKFVIPLEFAGRGDPFRFHACLLILSDENNPRCCLR